MASELLQSDIGGFRELDAVLKLPLRESFEEEKPAPDGRER